MISAQEMQQIALDEGLELSVLNERVASGEIVIVRNPLRKHIKPLAVGRGTRVKVNANLGASTDVADIDYELCKLRAAEEAGADAAMDLSDGGDIKRIRRAILDTAKIVIGTVPVYEAAVKATKERGSFLKMTAEDLLTVIEEQAKEGVDFFTLHCGITKALLDSHDPEKLRITSVVSRGGSIICRWIKENGKENPLFEHFDAICDICKKYGVALSLGDGMRPGAIADSLDVFQVHELYVLGDLTLRARAKGVHVFIEGPGHVPINEIEANMRMQKAACHGAPFYILGPLVTDIAMGYDHIAGAIGGAIAAMHGADFLCVVTPSEHISHPDVAAIKDGVVASRIAGHAVDLIRKPQEKARDLAMSKARRARDWDGMTQHALHPSKVKEKLSGQKKEDKCSMCGEFCSMKLMDSYK
jgi:phosphomethylpyrimidine synthase